MPTYTIDSERGKRGQDEIFEEVIKLTDAGTGAVTGKIRVQIHSNFSAAMSGAKVSVLTPALEWTELAVALPSGWHSQGTDLETVAHDLVNRAMRILA